MGAGHAGQAEADGDLVARARFFVDSREGVLAQGGEFLRAKAAGLVDDGHISGEIGEVLAGSVPGRLSDDEITVYKSLGHVAGGPGQRLGALLWRGALGPLLGLPPLDEEGRDAERVRGGAERGPPPLRRGVYPRAGHRPDPGRLPPPSRGRRGCPMMTAERV